MKRQSLFMFFAGALLIFCNYELSYAFALPDTGQTMCYDANGNVIACAGTGEDAAHIVNPMSYTDNGNGTVTDNVTGLMWQNQDDGNKYNWYQATGTYDATYNPTSQNVCGSLSLGGYSDWRLPAVMELMSIVNYGIPPPGPTINTTYFPNTGAYYWSSTTVAGQSSAAWYVYFDSPPPFVGPDEQAYPFNVRCVRGGPEPPQSLTYNGNGTVTDSSTGLMWQQVGLCSTSATLWTDALSYCNVLSLGGNSDWRLPNIKELASIVDYTQTRPSINTIFFPNFVLFLYWSSTTYPPGTNVACDVDFSQGVVTDVYTNSHGCVQCVRGGNVALSVSKLGTGSGTVTSSPSGISCGSTCSASYGSGTSVTLTAVANSGSTFTGWSGACSSQSASTTCGITMTTAKSLTANYVLSGTTPFSDVPSSSPYASYIEAIYNNSITTGCGTGGDYECTPDATTDYVTRDQMAAFLVRGTQVEAGQSPLTYTCTGLGVGVAGASVPCTNTTPYFLDVSTANPYFTYIQKLYELGITTGCGSSGDYECPSDDNVTRDQMAAFIIRALYGGINGTYTCNGGVAGASVNCATTTPYFSDATPATEGNLFPYIQKLYELGITIGCNNGQSPLLYCPSSDVTRDEMAAFLARAFLGMK